jgi:PIN domain nuclease of toxin-antitoxin system
LRLEDDLQTWLGIAASPATVELLPITAAVVLEMNRLPASFHQDPADRLIVASARAAERPLATHDARIRRSRTATLWSA